MGWPHCDDRHFQTLRSALHSSPKASSCYSVPIFQGWLIHFSFSISPVSSLAHLHFLFSTSLGCSIITSHDPCLKTQPHYLPSFPTGLFWETTLSAQINILLTDWCIDCLELCLLHKICHPDVMTLSVYLLASFLKCISLISGSLHSDSSWTWKLKFLFLTCFPSWLPELSYQRTSKKNIFKRFIILCVSMFYLHICIVSHVCQVPTEVRRKHRILWNIK